MTDLTPAQVDLTQQAKTVAKNLEMLANAATGQRATAEVFEAELTTAVAALEAIGTGWTPPPDP